MLAQPPRIPWKPAVWLEVPPHHSEQNTKRIDSPTTFDEPEHFPVRTLPLSREHGTYETFKARNWPRLSGKSPYNLSSFPLFARERWPDLVIVVVPRLPRPVNRGTWIDVQARLIRSKLERMRYYPGRLRGQQMPSPRPWKMIRYFQPSGILLE